MKDKLQEIKDYCKQYDYLDSVNLNDLKWLIEQAERAERMEMMYENTGSIMDRSHQIDKIKRYEKAFFALLDLGYEADMDVMIDIITDTLGGFALLEQYWEHATKGEKEFRKHYYID